MGALPQTGTLASQKADPTTTLGIMALMASLSAAGLAVVVTRKGKDETEN